ncbi:pseudouridine synthase [Hymenobacter sp. H14-R3]|uniref:pseudouridine synthase n=1 Tax=Hymenobacter sp. H14-R3 TaxID=3046308 RepID=UPI0024B9566B|nr:pseudouridine synthase [Hymenobacter sp. H14-R3]MDJ0364439.1 pseudouridine synthase [Hymenobacter sp. H14-R3]
MGKKHFSDDKPGRRGATGGSGRPSSDSRGSGGYAPRGNSSAGGGYKGSRPDGRGEGFSPARPTFGQGGGNKFGGRPSGGSGGSSFGKSNFGGGDRPERGSSSFGEKRSFGGGDRPERGGFGEKRSFGGDRPERGGFGEKRSFGGDRPERGGSSYGEKRSFGGDRGGAGAGEKRSFGGGAGYGEKRSFGGGDRPERGGSSYGEKRSFGGDRPERGGSSYSEKRSFGGDRPERPRPQDAEGGDRDRSERPAYPPKPIWQGQPVRYEGLPTVPRGGKGERNRKFIKTNPDGSPVEGGADNARPAYTGRDERRSFEERGTGNEARRPPSEGSRDERPARREFGTRPGGDDRRSNDREGGERRSSYGDRNAPREQTPGAFGKPRSFGERPNNTTTGSFRERREAMREAQSSPQRSTGYGNKTRTTTTDEPVGLAPDYKNLKHYENDKTRGNKRRASEEDFGTEELRLNRYIANAGICSRREADSLIAAGEIRVNGEVITEMGYKVQPTDTVQYGKTNLNREKLVYVLLNKPKDFITTTDDPEGRKTVMSLVATASKERIFPVGRLDRNTTGLLLFTNDGEVAQKLSHPSHKNKKIYQAELDKPLTAEHLAEIAAGIELEDGKAEVDDVAVVAGNPHFVGIELHIGRNRIVRRIFEHLGYDVVALDRVQYAGLTKKEVSRGKWRFLTEQEVIRLKYFM